MCNNNFESNAGFRVLLLGHGPVRCSARISLSMWCCTSLPTPSGYHGNFITVHHVFWQYQDSAAHIHCTGMSSCDQSNRSPREMCLCYLQILGVSLCSLKICRASKIIADNDAQKSVISPKILPINDHSFRTLTVKCPLHFCLVLHCYYYHKI